jgi:hypothetical protein
MGKLTTLLTGMVLLGLCFSGIFLFFGELATTYDITIDQRYEDTYAKFNATTTQLQNTTLTMQDSIEAGTDIASPTLGFVDQLFNTGWGVIKGLTMSFGIANNMLDATTQITGLDSNPWLSGGIKTVVILAIALLIIGIMMRRDL